MELIDLKGYKYRLYDGETKDDTKDYSFDENHVASLEAAEKYDEAADYLQRYEFVNFNDRSRNAARIYDFRQKARKTRAEYAKLSDEDIADIKFAKTVFTDNGYGTLRYAKNAKGEYVYKNDKDFREKNKHAAQFEDAYKAIGSSYTISYEYQRPTVKREGVADWFNIDAGPGNVDRGYKTPIQHSNNDATSLSITLPKRKSGAVWFFGTDYLVKDNTHLDEILNEVYSNTGFNKRDLIAKGFTFETKDNGDEEILFDKNSEAGKAFVVAVANAYRRYDYAINRPVIVGYDEKGNPINRNVNNPISEREGINIFSSKIPKDEILKDNQMYDKKQLEQMADVLSWSKNKKENITNKLVEDGKRDYSSTIFTVPGLAKAENKKYIKEQLLDRMGYKGMGTAYGYLPNASNNSLVELTEQDWKKIKTALIAAGDNDVSFGGMTVNGKTGLHVVIAPKRDAQGNPIGEEIEIFIPDLLSEYIGVEIDKHTDLQAQIEFNNMKSYGEDYVYTFRDGSKAWREDNGQIRRLGRGDDVALLDSRYNAEQQLINDINKDFILNKTDLEKGRYLNANGEYNEEMVEALARSVAYAALGELNPNLPITTTDGNPITPEMLFNNDDYKNTMNQTTNPAVIDAILEMYELYYDIIGTKNK